MRSATNPTKGKGLGQQVFGIVNETGSDACRRSPANEWQTAGEEFGEVNRAAREGHG